MPEKPRPRYRVHYLAADSQTKNTKDFDDYNEALSFWAGHGLERATMWGRDKRRTVSRAKWKESLSGKGGKT